MKRIDIAILTFALAAGRRVQLLPAGPLFRARDGRPEKLPGYRIDAKIAAALIARAMERQTPLVVDYEHQTLLTEKNGQPAPAAGWFRTLEWVEGEGLFATDMEWNARALEMIAAGEYKFISPVFSFDTRSGAVLEIQMAAITNNPALDGMEAVAAHRFLSPDQPVEEIRMNEMLKKLLAALGLQETATEADALSAVTALKAGSDKVAGLESEVAALKAATPDPEKFAPVATMKALQAEVSALTAKLNGQELDGVIAEALTAGKLLPAQESWARELGGKDLASLKSYLDTAPAVVPAGTQSGGKPPASGGGDGKLNDTELAVCSQLGITAEEFLKSKAGEAAAA